MGFETKSDSEMKSEHKMREKMEEEDKKMREKMEEEDKKMGLKILEAEAEAEAAFVAEKCEAAVRKAIAAGNPNGARRINFPPGINFRSGITPTGSASRPERMPPITPTERLFPPGYRIPSGTTATSGTPKAQRSRTPRNEQSGMKFGMMSRSTPTNMNMNTSTPTNMNMTASSFFFPIMTANMNMTASSSSGSVPGASPSLKMCKHGRAICVKCPTMM
jgi:hypothetical protein